MWQTFLQPKSDMFYAQLSDLFIDILNEGNEQNVLSHDQAPV